MLVPTAQLVHAFEDLTYLVLKLVNFMVKLTV